MSMQDDELELSGFGDRDLFPAQIAQLEGQKRLGITWCPTGRDKAIEFFECPIDGDKEAIIAKEAGTDDAVYSHWHDLKDIASDLGLTITP